MFFAYSAPLPPSALAGFDVGSSPGAVVLAVLLVCLALPALAFGRRPAALALPAPGPVFCERSRRWRDPVSGRLVKSPR